MFPYAHGVVCGVSVMNDPRRVIAATYARACGFEFRVFRAAIVCTYWRAAGFEFRVARAAE
jgi:hypothetical protein